MLQDISDNDIVIISLRVNRVVGNLHEWHGHGNQWQSGDGKEVGSSSATVGYHDRARHAADSSNCHAQPSWICAQRDSECAGYDIEYGQGCSCKHSQDRGSRREKATQSYAGFGRSEECVKRKTKTTVAFWSCCRTC